jgi:hypothetical protein
MNLLRPTAPPEADEARPDDAAADPESRGGTAEEPKPPAKPRQRKRTAPLGKTTPRNIHLLDDVHDRLWQLARQRKTSVSTVANDILDKNLPRYEVKRVT